MDKQIYLAIATRLKDLVADLKWIDYDWGQLNDERPAVAYPCALIDVAYTDCRNLAEGPGSVEQRVNAAITLKLIFQPFEESNANAPEDAQTAALSPLDTVDTIHTTLQGWNGNGIMAGLARRRATPAPRRDKLKVFVVTHETTFIHIPEVPN